MTNGKTTAKTKVAEFLEEVGEPRSLQEIAVRAGVPYNTANQSANNLAKAGLVKKVGRGTYQWVGNETPGLATAVGYARPDVRIMPGTMTVALGEPDTGPVTAEEMEAEAAMPQPREPLFAAPAPSMIGDRLEAIGFTENGVLILRNSSGLLYTASRLVL